MKDARELLWFIAGLVIGATARRRNSSFGETFPSLCLQLLQRLVREPEREVPAEQHVSIEAET